MLAKALPDYLTVAASSCEELLELQGKSIGSPRLIIVYIRKRRRYRLLRTECARVRQASAAGGAGDCAVRPRRCRKRQRGSDLWRARATFLHRSKLRWLSQRSGSSSAGGTYIPAHERRSATEKPDIGVESERRGLPVELDLTPRELSVLDLLREGKPNKLIATELNMEESTVKVHVRNILRNSMRPTARTPPSSPIACSVEQAPANDRLLRPASGAGSNSEPRYAEAVGG